MLRARLAMAGALLGGLLAGSGPLFAHCDGVDGPVVKAAQSALASGSVSPVLAWIQPGDEPGIRKVFGEVLAVRKLGPAARELADRHFFETLVRVHRAGEGAPFTGLKPAGRDLGPAIPAADKAIDAGKVQPLLELLSQDMHRGLQQRFQNVVAKKNYKADDTGAGREYVKAYVDFVHYVDRVHSAIASAGSTTGHSSEHEH